MEKKKKVKLKIKKQVVFNLISIVFVLTVGFYFLGRLIYYKIDSQKEFVFSKQLAQRLIEEEEQNIYESENSLVHVNGIYRYVGDAKYNYVEYKGLLWRVVKINADNSVTLITQDNVISLAHGDSIEHHILTWLNDKEQPNTGIFQASLEEQKENLKTTKICTDSFNELEIASCFETNENYKIGLLSVYDYLEANANESYLNNESIFWTSNKFDADNSWYVAEDGRISYDDSKSKLGIRPVITLDGDTPIYSGNGTADNPYSLNEKDPETLEEVYIGKYLLYNDTLWKVVSKEKDKIKIVSEECLKGNDGNCIARKYSDYSNKIDVNGNELMAYLNNDYYNSLKEKDFLTHGKFYTGTYSLTENNYRSSLEESEDLKVGFLSVGEIFAYEAENTFLMTTSPNNDLSIYSVNNSHSLYQNTVIEELNIRPSLYLKASIKIQGGDGSYLSPYQLGGNK